MQGMLRTPDPDPPLGGLWSLLRQALDPTTEGFFDRGVPGMVKGLVQNFQRNPIETVADFSPIGDAKALAYDAPNAFAQGNTGMGLLAMASAVPGVPGLGKLVGDAKRAPVDVIRPREGAYQAVVDGEVVGNMSISPMGPFASPVTINPSFRRQGVATAIYDQAERDIGRRIIPSPLGLTEDARAFWRHRLASMPEHEARALVNESVSIGEREGLQFLDHLSGLLRAADDLPMDEASRMARAREMGFDVDTPMYHGTNADFEAFDVSRSPYGAVFIGEDPKMASSFATIAGDGANVKPLYARPGKVWDQVEYPEDFPYTDMVDQSPNALRAQGYDSVRRSDGALLVFDPKNIRSRFARFDPAQSESSNLMAGLMGLLGTGALLRANSGDRER